MTIKASNFPTTRPTLDLNFAATKRLDPRVTFSRASSGTYVDGNGVLQSAATNVPRFDHNPTTGESLGLLVEEARTNDFKYSSYPSLWSNNLGVTVRPKAGLAPDGTFSAERATQDTATSNHVLRQYGATPNSNTYRISCFLKYSGHRYVAILCNINAGLYGCFDLVDGAASVGSITNIGNGWFYCQSINYTGSSVNTLSICLTTNFGSFYNNHGGSSNGPVYTGDGVSSVLIWGVQAEVGGFATSHIPTPATFTGRASTATYYDASGVIQTAGSGVARSNAYFPDENGVFRSAGLLLEAAGTNLMTRSEEFDNGAWLKTSGTVTADTTTAPNTTSTADTLAYNGVNRIAIERNTLATVVSGTAYATSLFVKVAGGDARYVQLWNHIGATSSYANFDIVQGALGSFSSNATPFIQKLSSNWYRIGFAAVSNNTIWYPCVSVVDSASAGRNGNYSGTTASIYLWGAQLEASPYPTSYIPTTTSTVTRAADTSTSATVTRSADVAQITGTNFSSWYNPSAGTWLGQVSAAYATTQRLFELGNSSSNQSSVSVRPGPTSTTFARQASGASSVNHSYPAKFAVADSVANIQGCVNGTLASLVSTGTSVTDDKLALGASMGGSNSANSIARLTYWPTRLPDATLQTITQ